MNTLKELINNKFQLCQDKQHLQKNKLIQKKMMISLSLD